MPGLLIQEASYESEWNFITFFKSFSVADIKLTGKIAIIHLEYIC